MKTSVRVVSVKERNSSRLPRDQIFKNTTRTNDETASEERREGGGKRWRGKRKANRRSVLGHLNLEVEVRKGIEPKELRQLLPCNKKKHQKKNIYQYLTFGEERKGYRRRMTFSIKGSFRAISDVSRRKSIFLRDSGFFACFSLIER